MRLQPSLFVLLSALTWQLSKGQNISTTLPTSVLTSSSSPKELLIQKIFKLITIYFSHDQALELTAFDLRRGYDAASIINDVGSTMQFAISPQQLRGIVRAYKGMAADLGSEAAASSVLRRAQLVLVVTNQPVVTQIRQAILTSSEPPSNTIVYETTLPLLTADRVRQVMSFIRQALAPNEWKSMTNRFAPIVRFDLYQTSLQ